MDPSPARAPSPRCRARRRATRSASCSASSRRWDGGRDAHGRRGRGWRREPTHGSARGEAHSPRTRSVRPLPAGPALGPRLEENVSAYATQATISFWTCATVPNILRPSHLPRRRMELDKTDRALVDAVLRDANQRLEDLARLVGLAPSSVHDRLRRLERDGVIRRWTVDVDAPAFGVQVLGYGGLRSGRPGSELTAGLPA